MAVSTLPWRVPRLRTWLIGQVGLLWLTSLAGASPPGRPSELPPPQTPATSAPAPSAELPAPRNGTLPAPLPVITLDQAVLQALLHNPQLAALRQQHGIAAAGVVIARTYPFNPVSQSTLLGTSGPPLAGITNHLANQHKITLDVQILGQQRFRKQAAYANLSRVDWEIASQEVAFAVNAVRAFDSFLYREGKLLVTEEFLRLNEEGTRQVEQLVKSGALRPAEAILARAEVNDVRSQIGLARTALIGARRDFYRALGTLHLALAPDGTLDRPFPRCTREQLIDAALSQRPDLLARRAAIAQAEAQLRFEKADRFGNPTVGPVYEYNETRVNFIGVQVGGPIPIFNCKPGEVRQREAELMRARLEARQTEVEILQDVPSALSRLSEAYGWVDTYRREVLPNLTKSLDEMDRLFRLGQPGVDVLRVLDVRRKLLRARDGYLDAQLAYTQALCDVAQAVGDPALAMGCYAIAPPLELQDAP